MRMIDLCLFEILSIKSNECFRIFPIEFIQVRRISFEQNHLYFHLGLTLEQFSDFVHSYEHQIDREDQTRETFLVLDRTCRKLI